MKLNQIEQFAGRLVRDIPDSCFSWGFEHPHDIDNYDPKLVLAATLKVPNATEGWLLATETCGGFGCYQKDAAIRVLEIQPGMKAFLQHIVDEEWYEDSLDCEGMCLPSSKAVKAYNAELAKVGLTFSAEESCAALTQALYPIDPTPANIELLSSTELSLKQIDPLHECGLVLYIVGDNCD